MKKIYLLFLFSIICSTASAQLVLNEAHFDPEGTILGDANGDASRDAADDEFLEFVNNSSSSLDISGYEIYDNNGGTLRHLVPASTVVPAGGIYIVFGGGDVSSINGLANVIAHTASTGNLGMTNTSEIMTVTDGTSTIITFDVDALGLTTDDNQSVARIPAVTGDFRIHQRINGALFSPGVKDASVKNQLVLNEIFAKPGSSTGDANGDGTGSSSDDEFIELVNNTGASIDISGYKVYDFFRFQSGVPNHIVAGSVTLADGDVFVLFGGGTPTGSFGGATVQTCSNTTNKLGINNSTDEIIIITDASDNVVCVYDSDDFGLSKDVFESLTRNPEVTGNFELHRDNATARFSPGFASDGITNLSTSTSNLKNTFNVVSGTWSTAGNWSKGTVPTSTENIEVPVSRTVNVDVNTAEVFNLNVAGTLNINTTESLKINGNLINSGTFTVNSGGSLIVDGTATGNIEYNRELTFVSGNLKGWHTVGSPVSGQAYNNAYATSGDNNLATSSTRRGIGFYTISSDTWTYLESDDSNAGTFTSGVGYAMKRASTGTVSFEGTLNTNNAGVDVTLSTDGNGFNPLANPYTSYISSATFLEGNTAISSTKTLWVWNQTLLTDGAYEVKTVAQNMIIAPGQGFFVKANAAEKFNFVESNQTNNLGTDTFQKSTPKPEIKLSLSDGDINYYTKIYYLDNATIGFDIGYEGEIFGGVSYPFVIYSNLITDNQNKKYQIQSLPNSNYENMIVPIGVNAEAGKEITFTSESLNLPSNIKVFLEDKFTNTFTRLDETNSNYKVTLTQNLEGIGRFYLHTKSSVLSVDNNSLNNVSIYKSNATTLKIAGLSDGEVHLEMFNILGKLVLDTSFITDGSKEINLPKLATGIYIVQLETENGSINKKITLE